MIPKVVPSTHAWVCCRHRKQLFGGASFWIDNGLSPRCHRLSQRASSFLTPARKDGAALTSRLQSFETELLTQEENLAGLAVINRQLIAQAEAIDSPQRVVLDIDSAEIPVYGQKEQRDPAPAQPREGSGGAGQGGEGSNPLSQTNRFQ